MYASTKSESYHLTEERAADQSVYFLWQFVALGLLYPQIVARRLKNRGGESTVLSPPLEVKRLRMEVLILVKPIIPVTGILRIPTCVVTATTTRGL